MNIPSTIGEKVTYKKREIIGNGLSLIHIFFRKVDYQQGLSNSAVLCLFQDNTGLMWFGTYDGVNCYDGRSMEVFRSDFSAPKALSNNCLLYTSRCV